MGSKLLLLLLFIIIIILFRAADITMGFVFPFQVPSCTFGHFILFSCTNAQLQNCRSSLFSNFAINRHQKSERQEIAVEHALN